MSDAPRPADVPSLIATTTLAEKVALLAGRDFWTLRGVPRLGVPSIWVADGPYGLRKARRPDDGQPGDAHPATCFPTSSALAATWDPALVEEVGAAIGREARAAGVSVLLGPGANLVRTPLCGRAFEYFSEDPLLSGAVAAAWIRGVQGEGVGASLKHFALNNQETRRFTVDVRVEERALRELYLASFEGALAARPWTVMAAYNRVDGVHCTESPFLLNQVLREEWGFDGVVVSDWGAVHDRPASIAAGLDLEMPGTGGRTDGELLEAVADGRLSVEAVDRAAGRVLALLDRAPREPGPPVDEAAHDALARRVAAEATVLLKNEGLVPLAPGGRVAVIGAFAKEPRYQGAGSAMITPRRVDDAWTAIAAIALATYAPGYDRRSDEIDPARLAEARRVARDADAAIVFVGLPERYETEGLDRVHLRLPPAHDALVAAVAAANPRTVVVVSAGAAVDLPWRGEVPAIALGWLGGQAGGSAVADVLFGLAAPGGRLPVTFAAASEDDPFQAAPEPRVASYREGLLVGYRYYDTRRVEVPFPFGHGLATTTFAWTDAALSASSIRAGDEVEVAITVTNTGPRAGFEVVQVYVHDPESTAYRPEQELKGFAKVRLEPGASERVRVRLGRRAFATWDQGRWVVEAGRYEIRLAASSRDVRATAVLDVASDERPEPGPPWSLESFPARYGRDVPRPDPLPRGAWTLDTPLSDMRGSLAAHALRAGLRGLAPRFVRDDPHGVMGLLVASLVDDMPLRSLAMLSGGRIGTRAQQRLLHLLEGHPLRALFVTARGRGRTRAG